MLEIYLSRCLSAPASRPGLSDNTEPAHCIAPLHCSRAACFAMEWSLLDYFRQEMLVHERLLVRARTGRNRQSEGPSQRVKDSAITMAGLAPLYSRGASKTAPRWQGLPLRACVPRSGVCTSSHTHLYSRSTSKTVPDGRACPLRACVPRSGVCASNHTHLYSRSTSKTVPRCERVFHARVCDIQRTHLSVLAARQRPRHEGRACPLRACVPRPGV